MAEPHQHAEVKQQGGVAGVIAHYCAGRTRLCFAALKGKHAALDTLCGQVRQLNGVVDAEIRPLTGSLIIAHWGTTEGLIEDAKRGGLFLIEPEIKEERIESRASGLLRDIQSLIRDVLGQELDIRSIAAFAFLVIAIRQIAAGAISPPAATALWNAGMLLLAGNGLAGMTSNGSPDAD